MERHQENVEIKVIVKDGQKKDGTPFKAFKTPIESGFLVDLRFTQDTDTTALKRCKKAMVIVEKLDYKPDQYEYPRFYASGIVSIKPII